MNQYLPLGPDIISGCVFGCPQGIYNGTVLPLTVTASCPVSLSPVTAMLKLWLLNTPPRPNSTVEFVSVHPPPSAPSDCPGTPALKPPPTKSGFDLNLAAFHNIRALSVRLEGRK